MISEDEKRIIEELFFVKNIVKYTIPISKKRKEAKLSKLEEEVLKTKSERQDGLEFLDEVLSELKNKKTERSFSFEKRKDKPEEAKKDSIHYLIKYQETEKEERLKVEGEDKEGKKYSFEIIKEKPVPEKQPYQLSILYENNGAEERLKVNYSLRDYPTEREKAMQDFTNQLDKTLHIMPKSIMGGILGYTYLGENFMARRDDLTGDKALMVDVHEAIHTPDEYETRVLTDWMLKMEKPKYKR